MRKRPNALKHGAFCPVAVLPGEDPSEFAAVLSVLRLEWNPVGLTEEDAVLTVATAIWRKRRVQRFLKGKVTIGTLRADRPTYDEVQALRSFCDLLDKAPEILHNDPLNFLSENLKSRLRNEFAAGNFKSTAERVRAIQKEIKSVLLPALEKIPKPPEISYFDAQSIITPEEFEQEVALDERLDAAIDRAIKRLMQIKTAKQILLQSAIAKAANTNEPKTAERTPNTVRPKGS